MKSMKDPLARAFGEASPDHFQWQTQHPEVSFQERELVRKAFLPVQGRLLDLGCGEGATLYHLGAPEGACGVDLFEAKVEFAQKALPRCRFVQASVYELPFGPASFDHVLVRDLIHHLDEPERFVDECARVLAPGGRLDVLEPCRNNPLILLHALTQRVERGELRSTREFLEETVSRRFVIEKVARYQPLPLHRIVFHPRLGSPALARLKPVQGAIARLERAAERWLPEAAWAYLHVRARLRAG